MDNKKILIVEDEKYIADLLNLHLSDLGAEVQVASDGITGLHEATAQVWDLIILDIQLPGPSGLQICRKIRQNCQYVPILLLTSRSSELDRVLGLDLGADDYITKPFSVMELIARIKAVFRRQNSMEKEVLQQEKNDTDVITIGALSIDENHHEVRFNNEVIDLTAKEFNLLKYFAKQPGRVFRRDELLDAVWGYGHDGYEHTVNSHINRLRAKIEQDPNNPTFIITVWGVGYKLDHEKLSA